VRGFIQLFQNRAHFQWRECFPWQWTSCPLLNFSTWQKDLLDKISSIPIMVFVEKESLLDVVI